MIRTKSAARQALLALICVLAAPVAIADAVDVANLVRSRGCAGARGTASLLQRDRDLDRVARDVARGRPLAQSLGESGRAGRAVTVFRFQGDYSERAFASALETNLCEALIDPALREVGSFGGPAGIWLVLATGGAGSPGRLAAAGDHDNAVRVPRGTLRRAPLDTLDFERQLIAGINDARSRARRCAGKAFGPAPPLRFVPTLERVAAAHSEDMAVHHEFDHAGHDGSTPAQRVRRAGYPARLIGENIAYGAMSPADAVDGWLASPPHCENIMDPRFEETGIAVAGEPGHAGIYFTEVFVQPKDARAADAR